MLSLPRIIAVCGSKRSGKDTIAGILSHAYGYEHIKISQKLKDVCKTLFGFTDEQLETDTKEVVDARWRVSPRRVMQFLGTEVMQYALPQGLPEIKDGMLGRKFWIESTLEEIKRNPHKKYIISDLRFLHEEDVLKEHGAFIIKVQRFNTSASTDSHKSEQEFKFIQHHLNVDNYFTTKDELRTMMLESTATLFQHKDG